MFIVRQVNTLIVRLSLFPKKYAAAIDGTVKNSISSLRQIQASCKLLNRELSNILGNG